MAQSKNLNMLLMDGVANGRIKRTISNWVFKLDLKTV